MATSMCPSTSLTILGLVPTAVVRPVSLAARRPSAQVRTVALVVDLRLEVWQGPAGDPNGPMIDQTASEPLATAPLVEGRRVSGEVTFGPLIDRTVYYVALTGLDTNRERWQLAWSTAEFWRWRGTPLQLLLTALRSP